MANYYVDETLGSDAGTGAIGDPWETINKINISAFNAGDSILFKKDEVWREKLTVPSSGSSGSQITFDNYGNGAAPKLLGSVAKNVVGDWTNEVGNLWYASPGAETWGLVFNSEASKSTEVELKASLDTQGESWWDAGNSRVYVYSVGNPATVYGGSIECQFFEYIVDTNDKSYLTFDGLDLRYTGKSAISDEGSATLDIDIIIQNCVIKYCGCNLSQDPTHYAGGRWSGRGIFFHKTTGLIVDNCTISHTSTAIFTYSLVTALVVTFSDNTISDLHGYGGNTDGIAFGGTGGVADYDGSVVSGNDISGFIDDGIDLYFAQNVIVRNNIVHDIVVGDGTGDGNGIKAGGHGGAVHSTGHSILRNHIYNINQGGNKVGINSNKGSSVLCAYNVIHDCTNKGIEVGNLGVNGENDNWKIYNNVCYDCGALGIYIKSGIGVGTEKTVTIQNNICDGGSDNDIRLGNNVNCTGGYNCLLNDAVVARGTGGAYSDAAKDLGTTNPLFLNAGGHNFHIQPYSPCAFAGIGVGLTEDHEGNPVGAVPNIGAYEFRKLTDVLLGPAGAMVKLPHLMWLKGSPPIWSVSSNKQMEMATMMDKSRRVAFFDVKREYNIGLAYLSKAQLDIMTTLNALNQILYFVNNNEDARCYEVVISSFRHEPERMDIRQLERYKIEMTLKEI